MCTEYIERHIRRLPPTQIFTTREVLRYGPRGAVDQALYRMVRIGFIVRLARGVFVRDASQKPTLYEIVSAKAQAWGKIIVTHAERVLREHEIRTVGPRKQAYAINAHSGTYWTIRGRVYMNGIGTRRMRLCKTKVGQLLYALWHIREGTCLKSHVSQADFRRLEFTESHNSSRG
jgi:hypothetical protein